MNYSKYLPVDPDFNDIIEELAKNKGELNVFFFLPENTLEQAKGEYKGIYKSEEGEFLTLKNGEQVRLDRIITINGKPGPAFDEYDNYANACLSCQGGNED
ncbi:hypothetical protein [Anaerophaga thermohalophila]|uniref:hypothetical protein n=1 Tax=Anaerophaga thermohalophila TaxID=177400 RepID=UPI00030D5CAD|nr:hypothetical protein [Anaerophaga thermohalophila]